jgi:hypothetical protein
MTMSVGDLLHTRGSPCFWDFYIPNRHDVFNSNLT